MDKFADAVDDVVPEPREHERVYYRHRMTGDLGYMVKENGKDAIRLDRPMERLIRAFDVNNWLPEKEARKMSLAQVAQICFEADRKLCFFLGEHELARREWVNLTDEQRIAWINRGPARPEVRCDLYREMRAVLNHHADLNSQ